MPGCDIGGIIEFEEKAEPDLLSITANELQLAHIFGVKGLYLRFAEELNTTQKQGLIQNAVVHYDRTR